MFQEVTLMLLAMTLSTDGRSRGRQADFVIRNFLVEQDMTGNSDITKAKDVHSRQSVTADKSQFVDVDDILQALRDFGLDDVSRDNPVISYMLQVYKSLESGSSMSKAAGHRRVDVAVLRADTIRGLSAEKSSRRGEAVVLRFNLSNIARHEVTKKAELRLHVEDGANRQQKYRIKVQVYRDGTRVADLKYTVKSVRDPETRTDVVDLTPVLQTVIDGRNGQTLIEVKLRRKPNQRSGEPRQQRRSVQSAESIQSAGQSPILVLFTKDKQFFNKITDNELAGGSAPASNRPSSGRQRRDSQRRQRLGPRQLCERHDFMIDFADIGWDKWIVYPKQYNAFYCLGRCPTPVDKSYDPTNHAILQGLFRLMQDVIPRPCCTPTKLRPLSMLYYEYNEIIVRQHKDMIANNCGCR